MHLDCFAFGNSTAPSRLHGCSEETFELYSVKLFFWCFRPFLAQRSRFSLFRALSLSALFTQHGHALLSQLSQEMRVLSLYPAVRRLDFQKHLRNVHDMMSKCSRICVRRQFKDILSYRGPRNELDPSYFLIIFESDRI